MVEDYPRTVLELERRFSEEELELRENGSSR